MTYVAHNLRSTKICVEGDYRHTTFDAAVNINAKDNQSYVLYRKSWNILECSSRFSHFHLLNVVFAKKTILYIVLFFTDIRKFPIFFQFLSYFCH